MNKFPQGYRRTLPILIQKRSSIQFRNYGHRNIYSDRVLVSKSKDVFRNLALEYWLRHNTNLTVDGKTSSILFMWTNKPAVVIGRNQNPFLECCVWKDNAIDSCRHEGSDRAVQSLENKMEEQSVNFARRESGGGTVYHDEGNVNFAFFSHKNRIHSEEINANLHLIFDAIETHWKIEHHFRILDTHNVAVNKDGQLTKISGSAAMDGTFNTNATHYISLLVDANLKNLYRYLKPKPFGQSLQCEEETNRSNPRSVINLSELAKYADCDSVIQLVGKKFLKDESNETNFCEVNPTDEEFPGLEQIYNELKSWKWVHGSTPNFSVLQMNFRGDSTSKPDVRVHITVEEGLISSITTGTKFDRVFQEHLLGERFWYDQLKNSLKACADNDKLTEEKGANVRKCVEEALSILK